MGAHIDLLSHQRVWRLHLSQSADRARILRRARLHLQFREPVDPISERRRHALRLGCVAILDQADPSRRRRLRLQRGRLRQRLRRSRGLQSQVVGAGPQLGFIIPPTTETQGYLNFKSYWEFASQNRPDGWNAWVTFVISPAEQMPTTAPRRMITK